MLDDEADAGPISDWKALASSALTPHVNGLKQARPVRLSREKSSSRSPVAGAIAVNQLGWLRSAAVHPMPGSALDREPSASAQLRLTFKSSPARSIAPALPREAFVDIGLRIRQPAAS